MNQHQIEAMVDELVVAGIVRDRAAAEKVITAFWQNKLVSVWSREDMKDAIAYYDDELEEISDFDADRLLQAVSDDEDANIGINWDVIQSKAIELGIINLEVSYE